MGLGLCCQWVEPRKKRSGEIMYENIINEKLLQLGRFRRGEYDIARIANTYHNNVDEHIQLVPKLVANKIKVFRITSNMLPLFEFNEDLIKGDELLLRKFAKLGSLFKDNQIRVTCHPGQFCILNSNEDRVIGNAIKELEYHAWMFDRMGFDCSPHYSINIHGGKRDNFHKLVEVINTRLPYNVKSRLTLENDERCFSVPQLVEAHRMTGVPVVFDSHHFVFNKDGMTISEAYSASCDTWNLSNCKPLQHLSNTEPGLENGSFSDRRKHSWDIHYIPEPQLAGLLADSIDVDVEAKGKNIALLNTREKFNIN